MKHSVVRLALVGLTLAALAAASCSDRGQAQSKPGVPAARPVPVLAALALKQSLPLDISTFGIVQANSTVTVRAQVTGILDKVHFRKGEDIKKKQLLFEIDPRPFQATIRQLEANKARDKAQLDNAAKELKRQDDLLKKGIASQTDFDKAQTDVATFDATVKADDAAIDNAKLLLAYCSISSPLDGRAGDLLLDEGNLVKANDTPLVTLDQVHPVEVSFSVPQRDLPAVKKYMDEGKVKVLAKPPDSAGPASEGELTFIDNSVDASTGQIRLYATFPNVHGRLWPGLYVDVVLTLTIEKDVTVVPSQAVQAGRDGQYVFVIITRANGDKIAEVRPVAVSRSADGIAVIASGVTPGEQVVTDGQVRLLPGAKVVIRKDLLDKTPATSRPAGARPATSRPARTKSNPDTK